MKVLWVTNILFPEVGNKLNIDYSTSGGWMHSVIPTLSSIEGIKLCVASPYDGDKLLNIEINEVMYIIFPREHLKVLWKQIIPMIEPDIIHLYGTEFDHGNTLMDVYPDEKYVVSIQGLVSVCYNHYEAYLPQEIIRKKTIRDVLRQDSIRQQANKFKKRGKIEKEILLKTKHIIGRTNWDKACTYQINPYAQYHHCNESLRDSFYCNKWDINKCERYSIFFSQGSYPLKGLHLALYAMPQILKDFPAVHLYIAGINITDSSTFNKRIKLTSYGKYLNDLVNVYKLKDHVTFVGNLSEQQMCKRMWESHVFLCASSIENSPNSLGEAMLIGMPCVSSNVGGVSDMLVHNEEGYLYPADEYYMISHYIKKVFDNDEKAKLLGQNAHNHARITHDKKVNVQKLVEIYKSVYT